jgi:DNA-binding CsgD family transcriptional regulator
MASQTSTATRTNGVVKDADALIATVQTQLGRPRGERPSQALCLDERLQELGQQLRAAPEPRATTNPSSTATMVERMYELDELRGRLRERDLSERLEVLARIRESMEQLHECETPEELIEAAPQELCRACGFSRAMISRIRGSKWVPVVYEAVAGLDPEADVFKEWVEHVEIPLEHMLVETEMVRRRMPVLVEDPANDPRTFTEIVTRGRTVAYVAAPIIPDGRAIGFLHADNIGREPVTSEDRDNIWSFAEQFGLVYHRAVLLERFASQREQLHEAFGAAEHVIGDLRESELELTRTAHRIPEGTSAGTLFRPAESRIDRLLTRREREVLELITSGATNVRIAEQLVISEGTVKSHVKHILRKLRVGNRAEAVSRYLQMLRRDQEQSVR